MYLLPYRSNNFRIISVLNSASWLPKVMLRSLRKMLKRWRPLTLPGVVHLLTGFQSHSKLLQDTLCFVSFKKFKYQLVIYWFSGSFFRFISKKFRHLFNSDSLLPSKLSYLSLFVLYSKCIIVVFVSKKNVIFVPH